MTVEQLKEAHRTKPFKPFDICLADGRKLRVGHPEFLLMPPGSQRTFVVAVSPDVYKVVDLLLVTALDFGNGEPK